MKNELDVLFRLGLILALYKQEDDVRARVRRLIPKAPRGIRPGLGIIVLAKSPRGVIQNSVDRWVDMMAEEPLSADELLAWFRKILMSDLSPDAIRRRVLWLSTNVTEDVKPGLDAICQAHSPRNNIRKCVDKWRPSMHISDIGLTDEDLCEKYDLSLRTLKRRRDDGVPLSAPKKKGGEGHPVGFRKGIKPLRDCPSCGTMIATAYAQCPACETQLRPRWRTEKVQSNDSNSQRFKRFAC